MPLPERWEKLPTAREPWPLRRPIAHGHAQSIDTRPSTPTYDASRWAAATLIAVLAGVVFLISWAAGHRPMPVSHSGLPAWVEPLVTIVAYGIAGAVFLDRRPDLPFGWLLAAVAVLVVIEVVVAFPATDALVRGDHSALARWGLTPLTFGFLPVAVQGLINVRFPSGRPATRGGAVLEIAIVAGTIAVLLAGFFGGSMGDVVPGMPLLDHPLTSGTTIGSIADGLVAAAPIVVLLGLLAGLGVVLRYLRAEGIERQQLKWRAVGVLTALTVFPLAVTERLGFLQILDTPLFVLTLVVPVLRYRLWAIDTILRRSVAYAVVIVLLVVAYAVITAALTRVASAHIAAPVAAAVVAISFAPLARFVRRLIDRLFYGDRSEPYRTVREIGRSFNTVPSGDVLGSLVQAVAVSLRLPYVALERPDRSRLAGHGEPGPVEQRWPLAYEQRIEGFLVASPRRGEDAFDKRDLHLLADIAGHIGVAVHADGLTTQLQRSRRQLVTAREEERRRLRRDLHDGLGPVLTAIGLNLDAARTRLGTDQTRTEQHIAEAKDATSQALADLRRLVHDLRPPVLDLGLAAALRSQVDRLRTGELDVTIDAPDLPELPAAAEVAAYRIAVEAVTNVVRHSGARHCCVRITLLDGELVLRIHDDGIARDPWTAGVGLTSMRERTDELGGTLTAGPAQTGGATVTAILPLPGSSP